MHCTDYLYNSQYREVSSVHPEKDPKGFIGAFHIGNPTFLNRMMTHDLEAWQYHTSGRCDLKAFDTGDAEFLVAPLQRTAPVQ